MKMGRLLVCMMIYTLHNCGGIFKYVFVFSFSFYRLTVDKDQCLKWISFHIVSHHFTSGLIKAKSQPPLPCILCWLELDFFHKKFRMAQGMEEEYCGLHDKGQIYLFFLTFLCHNVIWNY